MDVNLVGSRGNCGGSFMAALVKVYSTLSIRMHGLALQLCYIFNRIDIKKKICKENRCAEKKIVPAFRMIELERIQIFIKCQIMNVNDEL